MYVKRPTNKRNTFIEHLVQPRLLAQLSQHSDFGRTIPGLKLSLWIEDQDGSSDIGGVWDRNCRRRGFPLKSLGRNRQTPAKSRARNQDMR